MDKQIFQIFFNTKDETRSFDREDIKNNTALALISYIWLLCLVPMFVGNSRYAKYHANQGLMLAIVETVLVVLLSLLSKIVLIGVIFKILKVLVIIAAVIMSAIGILNCLGGKARELPFIGGYRLTK